MTNSRHCSKCGEVYFRRNLVEAWTRQNPGKRMGWVKKSLKLCLHCSGPAQANKIVSVATVSFSSATQMEKLGRSFTIVPRKEAVG